MNSPTKRPRGRHSPTVPRACERCGVVFAVHRSRIRNGGGRYCSDTCRRSYSPAERFWAKVNKDGPIIRPELGPCWVWTGGFFRKGYGAFGVGDGRRSERAHRYSWELATGTDPGPAMVCHKCDNPPCVNPAHLFLGKCVDNIRDMHAKGRHPVPKGGTHWLAKITEADVAAIRRRLAAGEQGKAIAADFGVSNSLVSQIKRGRKWAHVT